jgi:hypothetical protein
MVQQQKKTVVVVVEPYIDVLVLFTTDDGQHVGRNAFGL